MVLVPLDCAATLTVWPSARSPVTRLSPAPLLAATTFGCSPPMPVVTLLLAPKLIIDVACWASMPQSSTPISVLLTNWMIDAPPGDPVPITKLPIEPSAALANTSVGDIELRGRFSGPTRLAMGPAVSLGWKEKSVSWLFSRKPRTSLQPEAGSGMAGSPGSPEPTTTALPPLTWAQAASTA